jgi:hypothetical protein
MHRIQRLALLALALQVGMAHALAQQNLSDSAKAMVGAWEISNADRDKACALTFKTDPARGGLKLELEATCPTALPMLKDVGVWVMTPKDELRLVDGRGATVFEFTLVEGGLYEGERTSEGLYFLQAQAAIKAETHSPEQMFGEWAFLREIDQPLCSLTLSNASNGGSAYKVVIKPGCDTAIANFGLASWRLDRNELVLTGRGGNWRFSESDAVNWERIPLSADPLLLVRKSPQ